jgi:hypothetical protein
VIAECTNLDNDFCWAECTEEKLTQAGGYRYRQARRPELYRAIIGQQHESRQKVAWMNVEE